MNREDLKKELDKKKNNIELFLEARFPATWDVISFILKYRILALVVIFFFYAKYREQDRTLAEFRMSEVRKNTTIEQLTLLNTSILVKNQSNGKLVDELLQPFWKKIHNTEDKTNRMFVYNAALYEFLLEKLDLERFFYTNKTDFDVFPKEQAQLFYDEEMWLINEFLAGDGSPVYKTYENTWVDLKGNVVDGGYTRWVDSIDGHIFVYGMMHLPTEGKEIKK